MEPIAARLKRLRLAAGLSQRELAQPGVSYAYISRLEAGTRNPSVKALRKLAARLGVDAGYLETGRQPDTGGYLLLRTVEGDTQTLALFREHEKLDALEWARLLTAAENGGETPEHPDPLWTVEHVDWMELGWAQALAGEYAATEVAWTIKQQARR